MASPPSPPDPKVTAAAEASGNVNTAIANTIMGNANTTGFDGSQTTYQQIGTQQVDDGNGGKIDVPRYSVTNTLSPEQQHLYGQRQHATSIAQDAAIQGLHRINANTRTPLDFEGAPAAGTVAQAPTLGTVGAGPQMQFVAGGHELLDRAESALSEDVRQMEADASLPPALRIVSSTCAAGTASSTITAISSSTGGYSGTGREA